MGGAECIHLLVLYHMAGRWEGHPAFFALRSNFYFLSGNFIWQPDLSV